MSTQEVISEAMSLPLCERIALAQALWESINSGMGEPNEPDAIRQAIARDQELTSGAAIGRTQEQVMQAARRAIECA